MPYKNTPRVREGEPETFLHQAGEVRQRELVERLAASGPEGLTVLVRAFSESRTSRLRCYILDTLRTLDDPRVLPLIEAGLEDSSSSTRCHAIEALLIQPGPEPCRLLLPLLRDPSAVPRCRAIEAAARLDCGSPDTVAELLECATHPDWRVRTAAARALGVLRVEDGMEQLRAMAGDPRNAVRVAAAGALQQLAGAGSEGL
ncbi:MAG TPA: HEAT repeat domain-containing protein [Armatimonadota bacterium]|nr:HEAT repeat domain-containing protein [Armatimonadota bacterium]